VSGRARTYYDAYEGEYHPESGVMSDGRPVFKLSAPLHGYWPGTRPTAYLYFKEFGYGYWPGSGGAGHLGAWLVGADYRSDHAGMRALQFNQYGECPPEHFSSWEYYDPNLGQWSYSGGQWSRSSLPQRGQSRAVRGKGPQ